MSNKSPFKQLLTPTSVQQLHEILGMTKDDFDKLPGGVKSYAAKNKALPDWYFPGDKIGSQPTYNKLSEKDIESVFIRMTASGYNSNMISSVLGEHQKDRYNSYQSKVKNITLIY